MKNERNRMRSIIKGAMIVLAVGLLAAGCSNADASTSAHPSHSSAASPSVAVSTPTATTLASAPSGSTDEKFAAQADALGGGYTKVTPANASTEGGAVCKALSGQNASIVSIYEGVLVKAFGGTTGTARQYLADATSDYCPSLSGMIPAA